MLVILNRKINSILQIFINMDFNFQDQIILITGGTGALGSKVLECFARYGPKAIVVTYRSENEKSKTEKELKFQLSNKNNDTAETKIEYIQTDLINNDDVEKLVKIVIEKYGQIHVLANIVGGYFGGKTVDEIDEREWDKMMNVNLRSAFLISKYVLRSMKENQYGKIIHVSSAAGARAIGRDAAYAASKAGLIRLVESMKEDVKEFRVNVNCILPTIIDTNTNRLAMPSANFSKWIRPEDLANIIVFLCSEASKAINGEAIKTSGYA